MKLLSSLRSRLGGLRRETEGSLSVEAAIMAPTLVFALSLMYSTFDIFRYDAVNSKAAYTVGDLLSRETDPVDQSFIDGMKQIFDYITLANSSRTGLRVSVVRYDGDDAEMKLVWSHSTTGVAPLNDTTLAGVLPYIPAMSEEDTVIVVETIMPYSMPFRVGIPDYTFHNVVVTRPRFSSQLVWG